uniref:Uncharacterized protein n=1 Tax=Glossina austeni TaxID=7395 RepID=A0A1A9VJ55_GLOAU
MKLFMQALTQAKQQNFMPVTDLDLDFVEIVKQEGLGTLLPVDLLDTLTVSKSKLTDAFNCFKLFYIENIRELVLAHIFIIKGASAHSHNKGNVPLFVCEATKPAYV